MPISYALMLCIPIGLLFYFIARQLSRSIIGCFGRVERRAALAFGAFGVLLIPYLWIVGCLHEEFSKIPYAAISFLLLLAEGLALVLIFRPFPSRGMDESEPRVRVGP